MDVLVLLSLYGLSLKIALCGYLLLLTNPGAPMYGIEILQANLAVVKY